jgi:hypothetical protein
LSNFFKEFYHWLAVSDNEAQQVAKRTLVRLFLFYVELR